MTFVVPLLSGRSLCYSNWFSGRIICEWSRSEARQKVAASGTDRKYTDLDIVFDSNTVETCSPVPE